MRKNFYILSILLAALTSCRKGDSFEQAPYSLETSTRMAAELVKGAPECFGHIKHDKVTTLSQGVSLLDLAYLDKGERRKRAHRLITRGAAMESIAPSVKSMGETEFYELMETILHLPEVVPLLPKDDS